LFSRLNITAKGLILVLVPVLIEISFASYLAVMLSDTFTKLFRVQRSIDALATMTQQRGSLYLAICGALDDKEKDKNKRLTAIETMDIETTPFVLEEGEKFPEFVELREGLESFHKHASVIIAKFRSEILTPGHRPMYRTIIDQQELMPLMLEAKGLNDLAFNIEGQLGAMQPNEMARFQSQFHAWLILGLATSCAICLWISRAFTLDIVKRLKNISENTKRISYRQPLFAVQAGSDEIAELDQAVYTAGQELEEARKRELAILDNATDVLCSIDKNLRLRDIGKAATRNWGYEIDELSGRIILSLLTEENTESTRLGFLEIAEGANEGKLENTIRCKDGTQKTFLWTINWRSEDQIYYCVAHDVTQLRAMEKLKQDFLAMVSHDLRTPLNSVSIGLSMLAENRLGELPARVKTQLTKSRNSMEILSQLVHDLLELEKIGSGTITLQTEVASAAEVCSYAKEQLESFASKSGVNITGPSGDAAILVDVKRLTQVLVNLLSNAIKFSPQGSTIKFDVKQANGFVEIGITDCGPGIAPEHVSLVFDRFQQAGKSTNRSLKSTGLGLAIVQAIIREHGGIVGVESELGKGSRFWVQVPRLMDEEEDL
jgi:PAS domain S-box-containing protein